MVNTNCSDQDRENGLIVSDEKLWRVTSNLGTSIAGQCVVPETLMRSGNWLLVVIMVTVGRRQHGEG